MGELLQRLYEGNQISSVVADRAMVQYVGLCSRAASDWRDTFEGYSVLRSTKEWSSMPVEHTRAIKQRCMLLESHGKTPDFGKKNTWNLIKSEPGKHGKSMEFHLGYMLRTLY